MAYVTIPKDLTKVKNKVAFNLTKRQLICIGIGAAAGIPFYFLTRGILGNSNAAKATYKIDKIVLVNCEIFEKYLETFREY